MKKLLANSNWWNGPPLSEFTKFDQTIIAAIISAPEPPTEQQVDECTKFRTYGIALNTFRYVAKFIKRCSKNMRYADLQDDQLALILMIKTTQRQHFATEIANLEQNRPISKTSVLRNYNVFIDPDGRVRMCTRLEKSSNLSYDQKYPVLMPSHCHTSRLIVTREHSRVMHAGIDRTVESARNRFITQVKNLWKSVRKK